MIRIIILLIGEKRYCREESHNKTGPHFYSALRLLPLHALCLPSNEKTKSHKRQKLALDNNQIIYHIIYQRSSTASSNQITFSAQSFESTIVKDHRHQTVSKSPTEQCTDPFLPMRQAKEALFSGMAKINCPALLQRSFQICPIAIISTAGTTATVN